MVENINDGQMQKRPRKDVSGSRNPFFNHKHSQESREKMSRAATLRNQQYKKALDAQHHISMGEFLANNPTVEDYIKELAKNVIKEQIDLLVMRKQKQRISIPTWE